MNDEIRNLPVFPRLDEICSRLISDTNLILQASAGAGKTSLVPLAVSEKLSGKIIVTQPRRLAARSCAERIASLVGEKLGGQIGLITRFENIRGKKIEVVTDGVFLRMIQSDPSLSGIDSVILDEFHERSINSDLSLAFLCDAKSLIRNDLKILLMSATLSKDSFNGFFSNWSSVFVEGRSFPVSVNYLPPQKNEYPDNGICRLILSAIRDINGEGDVLVFLPGYKEMKRVEEKLRISNYNGEIFLLHGSMSPAEQSAVIKRTLKDKQAVILSTNVAETSITINSVRAVVDSGLVRKLRYDPQSGMNHRETIESSASSSAQRSGRAGRVAAGVAYRYWNEKDYRMPHDVSEILCSDLSNFALENAMWGSLADLNLNFPENPPASSLSEAVTLLRSLGFIDDEDHITESGKFAVSLPVHPRLAAMIINSDELEKQTAIMISVFLSDDLRSSGGSSADIETSIEEVISDKSKYAKIFSEFEKLCNKTGIKTDLNLVRPSFVSKLLICAYPDRIGRKLRFDKNTHYMLSLGKQAVLYSAGPQYIVAPLTEATGGNRVLLYAEIKKELIDNVMRTAPLIYEIKWNGWQCSAFRKKMIGMMSVEEYPCSLGDVEHSFLRSEVFSKLKKEGFDSLSYGDDTKNLIERLDYVSGRMEEFSEFSLMKIKNTVCEWLADYMDFKSSSVFTSEKIYSALSAHAGYEVMKRLDKCAPEFISLKEGKRKRIDYSSAKASVSLRIQELFGVNDNPLICGEPLVMNLLSPAGRPVQITSDIKNFWKNSYVEVRKEMKGRYPKHNWPEDPSS
ncbi:MAG: ATP-dependent helicase HrpB [Spirochaetes bacterium]|nr:ATP-dependent helicase HrpB [Spirochaetota bacterium]